MAAIQTEILKKAREISQEDIDGLCSTISEYMVDPDKSAECCGLLRSLFIILQASSGGTEPCISCSFVQSVVEVSSSTSQQRTLTCSNKCILFQMLISELVFEVNQKELFSKNIDFEGEEQNFSAVYMTQGKSTKFFGKELQDGIRWLQSQEFEKQKLGLAFVTAISLLHEEFMDSDKVTTASEALSHWLSSANTKQAPNPHAINPFRKDEETGVTEIDGMPNTNIFTVLNLGQYYTEDQLMNIFSFSLLYEWLLGIAQSFRSIENRISIDGAASSRDDMVKKMLGSLISRSVDYCFRVIDQCEKKARAVSDIELQIACLVEAIQVLDVICSLDKSQTARVFQEVKRLNTRLIQEANYMPVVIYILRFFFHHSTSVVHDPQETFKSFFQTVISTEFKDQGLMYDALDFLLKNLTKISETNILTDYFPNLFKILAWHPRVFLHEFKFLLPAMMNWDTSIEILHLLLDLPCMTAALDVIERAKKVEPLIVAADLEPTSSLEAFHNSRFRPLFSYITRCESGQGDTIDRLANLHSVLRDSMNSIRVLVCCQLVPVLLKIWFENVLVSEDPVFIGQLLPVILERSGLLFSIPELIEDVHKVFAEELMVLCKTFPEIITLQHKDLCEFLQTTVNIAGRVAIYCNLIHAVGEHCSQLLHPDCTSEVIAKYYESLEVVTYELLNQLGSEDFDTSISKVLSALISTLSKLASRSQDLIPRAILCLTKVAKHQNLIMLNFFTKGFLSNKATSLIALLKNPDSASLILSPGLEVNSGSCHLNNTNMASVMRGIHRLVRD